MTIGKIQYFVLHFMGLASLKEFYVQEHHQVDVQTGCMSGMYSEYAWSMIEMNSKHTLMHREGSAIICSLSEIFHPFKDACLHTPERFYVLV